MEEQKKIRLNKAIAFSGYCSRRRADELISAGMVSVNGLVITNLGTKIGKNDLISVNGHKIYNNDYKCYIILNKPVMTVCTVSDPQSRSTVMDYVPSSVKNIRLFPVGRLDFFSEGLLLLTNDGDLSLRMTHPSHHISKIYEVIVRGDVAPALLDTMRRGMKLSDGVKLMPIKIGHKMLKNGNTMLTMTLKQGVNRQIRKMCSQLGLVILRLRRISQGALCLGNLEIGQVRFLNMAEANSLRKSVGLPVLAPQINVIS